MSRLAMSKTSMKIYFATKEAIEGERRALLSPSFISPQGDVSHLRSAPTRIPFLLHRALWAGLQRTFPYSCNVPLNISHDVYFACCSTERLGRTYSVRCQLQHRVRLQGILSGPKDIKPYQQIRVCWTNTSQLCVASLVPRPSCPPGPRHVFNHFRNEKNLRAQAGHEGLVHSARARWCDVIGRSRALPSHV